MEISEIKAQLSITQVLAHYGITAIKNKQINCPFHEDKTPSMQVYEDKGLVYCHSSNCKNGGKHLDQIEIIQQKENCTKHEAIKKAEIMINGQLLMVNEVPMKSIVTEQNLNDIFQKLQQSFIKSDKSQAYAKERNINHVKTNMGFNALNSTIYKGLKNCIVFPLKDENGEITSFYGRSLTSGHYYSENRKGLYHNVNEGTTTIILTESIIDSATLQIPPLARASRSYLQTQTIKKLLFLLKNNEQKI